MAVRVLPREPRRCALNLLDIVVAFVLAVGASGVARAGDYAVTAQTLALAPNAGGQQAYALRLGTDHWEARRLQQPLPLRRQPCRSPARVFDFRFPICDHTCFWQFFVQAGGGLSNAGPLAELTWGTMIPLLPVWLPVPRFNYVPALRLDITTHMIAIRQRIVTWSYPLWVGVSVPFCDRRPRRRPRAPAAYPTPVDFDGA